MFKTLLATAALTLTLAMPAAPAAAQSADDEAQDPVVARVDGHDIRRSEVLRARAGMPQQYQSYADAVVLPVLIERLVAAKLLALAGRAEDLAEDQEVRSRIAQIEDQVIQEVYLTRYVARVVTEEALRERYTDSVAESPRETELRVRHILLKTAADAEAVIEELGEGADFVELAKERSTGPSAPQGGDIGYFRRQDVVPAFAEAAFALEPGETTEVPVETQFGWHVIRVEERREQAVPSFEESREELRAELTQEVINELVGRLRGEAKVERFNLDGSPLEKGGSEDSAPQGE